MPTNTTNVDSIYYTAGGIQLKVADKCQSPQKQPVLQPDPHNVIQLSLPSTTIAHYYPLYVTSPMPNSTKVNSSASSLNALPNNNVETAHYQELHEQQQKQSEHISDHYPIRHNQQNSLQLLNSTTDRIERTSVLSHVVVTEQENSALCFHDNNKRRDINIINDNINCNNRNSCLMDSACPNRQIMMMMNGKLSSLPSGLEAKQIVSRDIGQSRQQHDDDNNNRHDDDDNNTGLPASSVHHAQGQHIIQQSNNNNNVKLREHLIANMIIPSSLETSETVSSSSTLSSLSTTSSVLIVPRIATETSSSSSSLASIRAYTQTKLIAPPPVSSTIPVDDIKGHSNLPIHQYISLPTTISYVIDPSQIQIIPKVCILYVVFAIFFSFTFEKCIVL